jgi:hypothetical protein
MNTLQADKGKYLTQIADDLPIEERIFVRKVSGVRATKEYFRIATEAEVAEWEEYKRKQEEEYQAMMGYEDSNT